MRFPLLAFAPALCSVLPLPAQEPVPRPGTDVGPAPAVRIGRVPIHTGHADLGLAYGTWAAADSYKVAFHDTATFVPYLGRGYPHDQPWSWRTVSVRVGETELLDADRQPTRWHDAFRYEYRHGALTEVYDVLEQGLEQSFVIHQRPGFAGDLTVVGRVSSALTAEAREARHGPLPFRDEHGVAIVSYGAAFALDASGRRIRVATSHGAGLIELTVPAGWLAAADYPVVLDPLLTRVNVVTSADTNDEPDITYNDARDTVFVSVPRLSSANGWDLYCYLMQADFSGQTLVHSDLAAWNTPHARVSSAGASVCVAFQRNLSGAGRRLRFHVRTADNFTFDPTWYATTTPVGFDDWLPDVSGGSGATSNTYLLVYQRDDQNDPTTTDVLGRVVTDQGGEGTEFTIAAGCSDVEWPRVSEVADTITDAWRMVVFQRDPCGPAPSWVEGKLVDFFGNVSAATWAARDNATSAGAPGVALPEVGGQRGRFLVSVGRGSTFPDGRAAEIVLERVDWTTSANPQPTTIATHTLAGPYGGPRVRVGGIAHDNNTDSHWAVTTDHDHTHRVVERILAHLELPTNSPPVAPARPPPEPALPFA